MLIKIFIKFKRYWNSFLAYRQFSYSKLDNVVLGPELDKRFEVRHPENLKIGYKTVISGDLFINALGGVTIGKYCHVAKGLTVYSHNHNWHSTEYIPYDEKNIMRPVTIGDCVWIGCNVTIAPGTHIGDGAIISAGAVVFGEVPSCAIVRGNPAEVVGYRDKGTFKDLYSKKKFK